jgi:hypothetical protein
MKRFSDAHGLLHRASGDIVIENTDVHAARVELLAGFWKVALYQAHDGWSEIPTASRIESQSQPQDFHLRTNR